MESKKKSNFKKNLIGPFLRHYGSEKRSVFGKVYVLV